MVEPELLSEVPMFHALALNDLERLAGMMQEEHVPAGRVLFDVGDPGSSMYIVRRGKVRISIPGEQDEEVTLAQLGAGEFFGELALLDGQPRSARASTAEDTVLYALSRENFLSFVSTRPETALAMLSATAKRLRHTDELMRSRASFDVNEEIRRTETIGDRIADALARMAGSWAFIGIFIAVVLAWIALQAFLLAWGRRPFDEFPYQFLAFLLGVLASLQAPIIIMAQNRDATRDRIRADADFKINLKNEVAIERALERLEELKRQIPEIRRQIKEQEIAIRRQGESLASAIQGAVAAAGTGGSAAGSALAAGRAAASAGAAAAPPSRPGGSDDAAVPPAELSPAGAVPPAGAADESGAVPISKRWTRSALRPK